MKGRRTSRSASEHRQEFIASQYSGLYLNTMMGWPMVPSAGLYAGGPAYPRRAGRAVCARRPAAPPALLGVFSTTIRPAARSTTIRPAARPRRLRHELRSRHRRAVIGEIQYAVNQPRCADSGARRRRDGLPGTWNLALVDRAFPDSGRTAGLSLADPASAARRECMSGLGHAVADRAGARPGRDRRARRLLPPGTPQPQPGSTPPYAGPAAGDAGTAGRIGTGAAHPRRRARIGPGGLLRLLAPRCRAFHRGHLPMPARTVVADAAGLHTSQSRRRGRRAV